MVRVLPVLIQVSQRVNITGGISYVEYRKKYFRNGGIAVRGEIDEKHQFHMSYYYPFFTGSGITTEEYVDVEKHAEKNSYAGICDEVRVGVTLIFYLQNVADYFYTLSKKGTIKGSRGVVLSGLAKEGCILLPMNKTEVQRKDSKRTATNRNNLIAAAREGNEEAIENLTLEDIDTYSMLSRRILTEDVFTIVDTCFMPYGIESDQYYIVGEILDVVTCQNESTQEEIIQLRVNCNDLIFNVCINRNNLLGEPAVGRRFKGAIWLQGNIRFEN